MAYLEQLADWVAERDGCVEWSRRLREFERMLDVDCDTPWPYSVKGAPEQGTPEFAEWWDSAIAECWWLQNNEQWSTCGWVCMGWYFQILGALVGVDILYPHRFHYRR